MQSPWIPRGNKRKISRATDTTKTQIAPPQSTSRDEAVSEKLGRYRDRSTTTGSALTCGAHDTKLTEFSHDLHKTDDIVKICPQCGSTSIHPYSLMMGFEMDSSLREYCMSCAHGYNGQVIFPAVPESELEEFKRKMKEEVLVPW